MGFLTKNDEQSGDPSADPSDQPAATNEHMTDAD